jgi:hypothetical protein
MAGGATVKTAGELLAQARPGEQHRRIARPLPLPAMGGGGYQTLMPGPWTRSVIHFAIGGRQVMTADRNQQSVIS